MIVRRPGVAWFSLALCICQWLVAGSLSAKQNSGSSPDRPQPSPSSQAGASEKKSARPKKVYTEDDLRSGGSTASSAAREVDLSDINSCDRNCRAELLKGLVTPGGWDSDKGLARALEGIRGDAQWQAALHAYARYRVRFCELEKERERASKDPTAAARTAEYARKEKALGDEMRRNVRTRWSDPYWIGSDPILNLEHRFTSYQVGRIIMSPCKTSSDP